MNYFKLADAKGLIQGLDEWIRSRIRIDMETMEENSHTFPEPKALRNQGRARRALSNERFKRAGYLSFMECYSAK